MTSGEPDPLCVVVGAAKQAANESYDDVPAWTTVDGEQAVSCAHAHHPGGRVAVIS